MTNVQINSQGKVYTANGQALLSTKNIQSLNVTPSTSAQTITASSGTDGYSPVNVAAVTASIDSNISAENIKKDVQILGVIGSYEGSGGGSSLSVRIKANYWVDTNGNVHNIGNNKNNTSIGAAGGVLSATATTISTNNAYASAYYQDSDVASIDLSAITTISGDGAFRAAFSDNYNLEHIEFSSLSSITGSVVFEGAFQGCLGLSDISFPALTTTSFGSYINQFADMLYGVNGRPLTLHFPSNMQSTISNLSGYPNFGGGSNVTCAFDLPATN